MTLRRLLLPLLSAALLSAAAPAGAQPVTRGVTVAIGGTPVVLPQPAGFDGPQATPERLLDILAHTFPPSVHILSVMMRKDFATDGASSDPQTRAMRYLIVQTLSAFEHDGMSPEMFEQVKASLRRRGEAMRQMALEGAKAADERMSRELAKVSGDDSVTVHTTDVGTLGIFDDRADAISLAGLETSGGSAGGTNLTLRQAIASTTVLLHGKPVTLSIYSNYRSPADLDWVKAQARDWATQLHELNP